MALNYMTSQYFENTSLRGHRTELCPADQMFCLFLEQIVQTASTLQLCPELQAVDNISDLIMSAMRPVCSLLLLVGVMVTGSAGKT